MINITDAPKQIAETGFLLHAVAIPNEYGTLKVFNFKNLIVGQANEEQIGYRATGGLIWQGAQENPLLSPEQRKLDPRSRTSRAAFLPYSWKVVEHFETTNGGRFLSLDGWKSNIGNGDYVNFPSEYFPDLDVCLVVPNDLDELSVALQQQLIFIGTPINDVPNIIADILDKLSQANQ